MGSVDKIEMDGALLRAMGRALSREAHRSQDGRKQDETLTRQKGCTARTKDHSIQKWQKAGQNANASKAGAMLEPIYMAFTEMVPTKIAEGRAYC
jgi:hypothetical protein